MTFRIPLAIAAMGAWMVVAIQPEQATAIDRFWQGDVSSNFGGAAAAAGNWNTLGGTGTLTSPRASMLERAVIGTDDPAGALNCNNAPFGCAVISSATAAPGGIALGQRVVDFDDLDQDGSNSDFLYEPAPAAGALVGKLTIHAGGNIAPVSTAAALTGADGRVLVGVQGRGYLVMDGGTLTAPALIVGGENITTNAGTAQELGPSLVDLSGNASLQITGGTSGIANLDRRLKVTGPSVNFNATGRIRFQATSSYQAVITSATAHSPLKTSNNALVNGALAVEFSGAAATRDPVASLGQTWNLVDSSLSTNAIDGNFNNLGPGGLVQVTGLDAAHAAPLGANYRVKKVASGGHSLLQLSYEQTLVLTVNRDNGQVSIRNPLAGQIAIDAYSITSARGSLVASYNGLGSSTPNAGVWDKPTAPGGNTTNALSEVKQPDTTVPVGNQDAYNLFSVPSVSLGTGFSRTGVAANINNFGFDGEDLIFEFSGPGTGGVMRGQVEYVGTKFENDLVLRVNPTTGQAYLKNDSQVTLKFDGYSVLSSTGNLNSAGFTGLGGSWQSSPATANALTQSNLTGMTTLAPGAQLAIGDISATGFTTDAAKTGLTIQYILAEGLTSTAAPGDYNNNGVVDAADYTVWRDKLNSSTTLPNDTTPGSVTQADYDVWKANFGLTGGGVPETTFRVGSVVFDSSAGAGGGSFALQAVPEPATGVLMLFGAALAAGRSRRRQRPVLCSTTPGSTNPRESSASGGPAMSPRIRWSALYSLVVALFAAAAASAATQGISLSNGDFELPGPTGTKVVAFGETGIPFAPTDPTVTLSSGQLAGGIPGWTFTGGSGIPATGEINVGVGNTTFGDGLPGDSGTEGGGHPGNEMILSTLDGRALQTSAFNIVSLPTTQKYQLSFDARNIYTPTGAAQVTARLYYVTTGSVKQTFGEAVVASALTDVATRFTIDVPGGSAAISAALGRPIGVEFDTTSRESDATVTESWAGIDNVLLQVTGVKRGDLDGDGDIDAADYAVLRDNLQEAHTYEFEGELTGDRLVDLNDFRAFKSLYAAQGAAAGGGSLFSVPEPTSAMLVLLATLGALAATSRRRGIASGRLALLAAPVMACVASLISTTPAAAVLLAYDPFAIGASPAAGEYTLGALDGQNPAIGPNAGLPSDPYPFFSGGWTIGSAGDEVQATGLSYRGAPSLGGSVTAVFDEVTGTGGEGRTGRYLTTPWDSTKTGTYYISYMGAFGTVADPNTNNGADLGFRTTEFWPVGGAVGNDNGRYEIGYQGFAGPTDQQLPRSARLHFNGPGTGGYQFLTDTTFNEDNNNTHLIVIKFQLSDQASSDIVSVFLDPVNAIEPIVPNAVATGIDFTLTAISTISKFGTGTGIRPVFDELRVGTEYGDVLVDFPMPGDTNDDDKVDMLDYQAIISHMNLTGQPLANGDVTGDGRVTIADYRYWKDRRTDLSAGAGSSAGVGVPEPTSVLLLAIGGLLTLVVGRRRAARGGCR